MLDRTSPHLQFQSCDAIYLRDTPINRFGYSVFSFVRITRHKTIVIDTGLLLLPAFRMEISWCMLWDSGNSKRNADKDGCVLLILHIYTCGIVFDCRYIFCPSVKELPLHNYLLYIHEILGLTCHRPCCGLVEVKCNTVYIKPRSPSFLSVVSYSDTGSGLKYSNSI